MATTGNIMADIKITTENSAAAGQADARRRRSHRGPLIVAAALGCMLFALGTHPPMNERQMCRLLGITEHERVKLFAQVGLYNHEWDDPASLLHLGSLSADETREISGGLLSENVPVTINSRVADYDVLLVLGPVFPHEVVGFSGGNKYFFPGIA